MLRSCNISAFWNTIAKRQRSETKSNIKPNDFSLYYSRIMDDDNHLTDEQNKISEFVDNILSVNLKTESSDINISAHRIANAIDQLKYNCSPTLDGISSEHLRYGNSSLLNEVLAYMYTVCMRYHIVPTVFKKGVIVPVITKPCLNLNAPSNFRQITLMSTMAKVMAKYVPHILKSGDLILEF